MESFQVRCNMCGHGLSFHYLEPLQDLHYILPLSKGDSICIMPHLHAQKVVHHIQVLHLKLGSKSTSCNFNEFLFSSRDKSSKYNRRITILPPSTLKQRLEYALLSVKHRSISKFSIMSYHVEPQDLLESLPLKWSIILPLPFVLYVLKNGVTSSFLCY